MHAFCFRCLQVDTVSRAVVKRSRCSGFRILDDAEASMGTGLPKPDHATPAVPNLVFKLLCHHSFPLDSCNIPSAPALEPLGDPVSVKDCRGLGVGKVRRSDHVKCVGGSEVSREGNPGLLRCAA